jgi:hypothetical protein
MITVKTFLSISLLSFLLLVSCDSAKKSTAAQGTSGDGGKTSSGQTTSPDPNSNLNFVTGTITESHLDGCRWLLHLDSGKNLEAAGIPPEFLVDGMRVRIKYVPRKGGMSICMAGEMVTVVAIEKAD